MRYELSAYLTSGMGSWPSGISPNIALCENGLTFGMGSVLARVAELSCGLELDADRDRILVLLSVACGKPVSPDVLKHFEAASAYWQRGDKALANLRLVFADLPQLVNPADAYRMRLAEYLLDEGLPPLTLMTEVGLDPSHLTLVKYDPDQPRVPAGNGDQSGRWSSTGTFAIEDFSVAPAKTNPGAGVPAVVASSVVGIEAAGASGVGTLASGLFAAATTAGEFLAGLAAFAAGIGSGIVAGALIIPSPNKVTTEGALPGDSELRYSFNIADGLLRLTRETETETEVVAVAHRRTDGIFFEAETGIPIARDVGGSVVFDAASLADVAPEIANPAQAGAQSQADADTGSPQLCPAPSKDVPHGASAKAIAYQALISALNNPTNPLRVGMAVSLINPMTGRRVVYDDCRRSDGTMIEAKGPGYAKLLRYTYFNTRVLPERWTNQAGRQIAASGGRNLDWFFAEDAAATRAREIFDRLPQLNRINVLHVPAAIK